jgi:hypothetical protein
MLLTLLLACPTTSDDKKEDSSGTLSWYAACGDPVCRDSGWVDKDLPACDDQVVGETCATDGERCDPHDPCNSTLLCTTEDPATECPISLRSAKKDVRYLDGAELAGLHDRLVGTKLAAWRYVGDRDDGRVHYGFVIDDDPTLPAADAERGVVDLYTWATMSAATLQVQEKRIAALEAEIAALKASRR